MTLREFTKAYLPLPEAKFEDNPPRWRKVFPSNLRFHRVKVKDGYYRKWWSFEPANDQDYVEAVYKRVLEEEWERVHKDEIIDREWRAVKEY